MLTNDSIPYSFIFLHSTSHFLKSHIHLSTYLLYTFFMRSGLCILKKYIILTTYPSLGCPRSRPRQEFECDCLYGILSQEMPVRVWRSETGMRKQSIKDVTTVGNWSLILHGNSGPQRIYSEGYDCWAINIPTPVNHWMRVVSGCVNSYVLLAWWTHLPMCTPYCWRELTGEEMQILVIKSGMVCTILVRPAGIWVGTKQHLLSHSILCTLNVPGV